MNLHDHENSLRFRQRSAVPCYIFITSLVSFKSHCNTPKCHPEEAIVDRGHALQMFFSFFFGGGGWLQASENWEIDSPLCEPMIRPDFSSALVWITWYFLLPISHRNSVQSEMKKKPDYRLL